MLPPRNTKTQYSESEAAQLLGMSVEELRQLVRSQIVKEKDDEGAASQITSFQPADLVVLRILAKRALLLSGTPAS
jgi:hypothetical protein